MKRPNLQTLGIEEEEDSQDGDIFQVFNQILEEIFPKLKQKIPIQVRQAYSTTSVQKSKQTAP